MTHEIRIGSRDSELAVTQANIIIQSMLRARPELTIRLIRMKTTGDLSPEAALEGVQAKRLFTDALEDALRSGEIDLCVHSLKDMAECLPDNLPILAFSQREDPRDALIVKRGCDFTDFSALSESGAVGCSSARRRAQLAVLAPTLSTAPIRGNVPTRIKKLDHGDYGSIVLAAAGLKRLGLADRISRFFSLSEMIPAAGQGVLAVQGRDDWTYPFLDAVDDPTCRREAMAERAVITALGCGCSSPAAAFARSFGTEMEIWAMYAPGSVCGDGSPSGRAVGGGSADGAAGVGSHGDVADDGGSSGRAVGGGSADGADDGGSSGRAVGDGADDGSPSGRAVGDGADGIGGRNPTDGRGRALPGAADMPIRSRITGACDDWESLAEELAARLKEMAKEYDM
ncbi:MAG: hydroxymethylbilane synthase [Clostridiales Family XIII bacterium]|nr:hydroxymethylbilane synthase [Clostridiales Family XIII bacterium]